MAVNVNNLIKESDLNQMTGLAFRGHQENPEYLNSALQLLNKSGLDEAQTARVAAILNMPCSEDPALATKQMKERITAVLSGAGVEENAVAKGALNQPIGHYYSMTDHLCLEIVEKIFFACFFNCDYEDLSALACVNWNWNECSQAFWDRFDLKQFCPAGLNILDAKTRGTPVDDEPQIGKLAILKSFKELAPHVEGNGCTLLTMCKGDTLNQLVEIAAEKGMTIKFSWDQILKELGDVPVVQSYVILITNSIFKDSRRDCVDDQKIRLAQHGCEMLTVQEYVALCVFTQKIFDQCLYGKNPRTYGLSSTCVGDYTLVVGGSAPGRFRVQLIRDFGDILDEPYGAGGRRKF